MPAEVWFDMKLDRPLAAITPPARSFRLALAAVLATLSAVALAFVGNPVALATASQFAKSAVVGAVSETYVNLI